MTDPDEVLRAEEAVDDVSLLDLVHNEEQVETRDPAALAAGYSLRVTLIDNETNLPVGEALKQVPADESGDLVTRAATLATLADELSMLALMRSWNATNRKDPTR